MTFTTLIYPLFVVLVFLVYWGMRGQHRLQNLLLLAASYTFYGWWDWRFCGLMLASSLVDYLVGNALPHARNARTRKFLLCTSLTANLGMLGFFKYFDFFSASLATLLNRVGIPADPLLLNLVLPVGISFYTFQTLSYTIDIYRGRLEPTREFIAYMAYVSFFPQLVAGPIERAGHLLPQFLRPRSFDAARATDGCRQLLWGFFKKMAIADRLGDIVNPIYGAPTDHTGPELLLATFCFAFQVYCDFSAYSDIAIGSGRLFGFDLMQNFDHPFFSRNIREFWRRWHISLSTWFRDYVYVPMGGSRAGRWRTASNTMLTFVISGLWHGASWQFAVWGAINGAAMLPGVFRPVARHSGDKSGALETPVLSLRSVLAMVRTFAIFNLGLVFFRSKSLADAMLVLRYIVSQTLQPRAWAPLGAVFHDEGQALMLVVALVILEWLTRRHPHVVQVERFPRWARWTVYTLLLWGTLAMAGKVGHDFVYFQF